MPSVIVHHPPHSSIVRRASRIRVRCATISIFTGITASSVSLAFPRFYFPFLVPVNRKKSPPDFTHSTCSSRITFIVFFCFLTNEAAVYYSDPKNLLKIKNNLKRSILFVCVCVFSATILLFMCTGFGVFAFSCCFLTLLMLLLIVSVGLIHKSPDCYSFVCFLFYLTASKH